MCTTKRDHVEQLRGLASEEAFAISISIAGAFAVPSNLKFGFVVGGRGRLTAAGDARLMTWRKERLFLIA